MPSEFYLGEKIVCTDDRFRRSSLTTPVIGGVYTIRGVITKGLYPYDDSPIQCLGIFLQEIRNKEPEMSFSEWRFAPLEFREEKSTDEVSVK